VAGAEKETDGALDPDRGATEEVGSEGGTFGDVEVGRESGRGTGSEAGETWHPADKRPTKVVRDETGRGRRSP
jgi:hypothetical protein